MGTYDISRVAFDPAKHFTSVRMQQGRVLTDDDFNENERISNEDLRRSRVDIIGPYGSPDQGFRIENVRTVAGPGGQQLIDFDIDAGTLYLGGLRLVMESLPFNPSQPQTFLLQSDYLELPYTNNQAPVLSATRYDLVYLETWQQPVCAVEDQELFEYALGGPDTSVRLRNMQRVKILANVGAADCAEAWSAFVAGLKTQLAGTIDDQMELVPDTTLTVSFSNTGNPTNLCSPQVAGGYLGADNQAIRVQLRGKNLFTWGFDNASPLYQVQVAADNRTVTLLTDPKDQYHWPLSGQVVEILPWSAVLPNGQKLAARDGFITTVQASYNPDTTVFTLTTPLSAGFGSNWSSRADSATLSTNPPKTNFFYLRVWLRGTDTSSPAELPFSFGTPVTLGNTGLEVTINGTDQNRGDYWVIAARPETPNVIVPWKLMTADPPMGVHRFFAPLGIIQWTANGAQPAIPAIIHDCRKTFQPLTAQDCCCTYSVGDGIRSKGDFNSIEDALAALPTEGGKICVLPGIHRTNAIISGMRQVIISGCGDQTIVLPRAKDNADGAVFLIGSSYRIRITNLTIFTLGGIAVEVGGTNANETPSRDISVDHCRIIALLSGIYVSPFNTVRNSQDIHIFDNVIGILDLPTAGHGIYCTADDVLIERNRLVVIPVGHGGGGGGNGGGCNCAWDPCCDRKKFYNNHNCVRGELGGLLNTLYGIDPVTVSAPNGYTALGGIQIGGSSERVWIYQNEIIGGAGNGITLGNVPFTETAGGTIFNKQSAYSSYGALNQVSVIDNFRSTLYDIVIEENFITSMGLSGIGPDAFLSTTDIGLVFRVEGLAIDGNIIVRCAQQVPSIQDSSMLEEVAWGGICLIAAIDVVIRDNRIENNGLNFTDPISGIYILYGERIAILRNRILNNGIRTSIDQQGVIRPGERGGIVIRKALQLTDTKNLFSAKVPASDAVPAATIEENIVDHPYGHALFLIAFGQVAVTGNQFTSKGNANTPYSVLAGTVLIFDLGMSKDLLFLIMAKAGSFVGMGSYGYNSSATPGQNFDGLLQVFEYLPSGRVLFSENQVTMDMRNHVSTISISSQLIVSLDDIGYNSNQSECIGFITSEQLALDIALVDVLLAGVTVRSNDNRFAEGVSLTIWSLLSLGLLNTAIGNQSTHCLLVLGVQIAEANNLVFLPITCDESKRALITVLASQG